MDKVIKTVKINYNIWGFESELKLCNFNPKLRESKTLKSKKILTILRKEKEILEYTFNEGKSIKGQKPENEMRSGKIKEEEKKSKKKMKEHLSIPLAGTLFTRFLFQRVSLEKNSYMYKVLYILNVYTFANKTKY